MGMHWMMVSMVGRKPAASSWSDSSRTSVLRLLSCCSSLPVSRSRWSSMRPGVTMRMDGKRSSYRVTSLLMFLPPMKMSITMPSW
jgi:hypothetical protein